MAAAAAAAATSCCISSFTVHRHSNSRPHFLSNPKLRIRCASGRHDNSDPVITGQASSESGNLMLKTAWYASELLGIAASFFRPPDNLIEGDTNRSIQLTEHGLHRSLIVETIKGDFQRSYFVTGDLTLDAYEDDCEFADPAGSFKGLRRFKRNCTNFGSLIEKSSMKLMKWEDYEDKGIGHWRFSCIMRFPWKPILSATGYTEYYLSKESGKVCRHVEHWNVPKMALFKQLLKPSRRSG